MINFETNITATERMKIMFDYIIRNGTIIDGSANAPFLADIAILSGRIEDIRPDIPDSAKEEIDASGFFVTPGFIDIHRHADADVFTEHFGKIELSQGITTIINGNCGLSVSPCPPQRREEIYHFLQPIVGSLPGSLSFPLFSSYMKELSTYSLPLNVGCCIGNGTIRMAVKGFSKGRLSPDEVKEAHHYLRDALENGALGVTLGIVYSPENCYDVDGFTEVLAPMSDYQVPLVTHIRGEGDLLLPSLQEVITIAKRLHVPLHISHFKSVGKQNSGKGIRGGIELMDKARAGLMDISCDVYPYTAGSSQLIQLLPPEYQEGGTTEIIRRLSDVSQRRKLVEILKQPQDYFENLLYSIGWESVVVTTVTLEKNQQYVGKTIPEIARILRKDPYDCAFDLLIEENCNVAMVAYLMDEKDVLDALRYPYSSLISDSVYPGGGLPHPRLYAAFTKVLKEYVRDGKYFTISEAIAKMTSLPARVYNIGKKGLLHKGYNADINIFKLQDIDSQASYTAPRHLSEGMHYVFVNGIPVIQNTRFTGLTPGRLLT